jgi:purine-binding chemotaxis protein CheW
MDIAKIRKKLKGAGKAPAEEAPRPSEKQAQEPQEPAEAPAQPLSPQAPPQEEVELLVFRLMGEEYAFRVEDIQEILRPQRITRVPRAQEYVLGVTSLRGKVVPVLELRKRLLLGGEAEGAKRRILIVKGPKGFIGAMVDEVVDVLKVPQSALKEPPGHLPDNLERFIEGVALWQGQFISLLKVEETTDITKEAP